MWLGLKVESLFCHTKEPRLYLIEMDTNRTKKRLEEWETESKEGE